MRAMPACRVITCSRLRGLSIAGVDSQCIDPPEYAFGFRLLDSPVFTFRTIHNRIFAVMAHAVNTPCDPFSIAFFPAYTDGAHFPARHVGPKNNLLNNVHRRESPVTECVMHNIGGGALKTCEWDQKKMIARPGVRIKGIFMIRHPATRISACRSTGGLLGARCEGWQSSPGCLFLHPFICARMQPPRVILICIPHVWAYRQSLLISVPVGRTQGPDGAISQCLFD